MAKTANTPPALQSAPQSEVPPAASLPTAPAAPLPWESARDFHDLRRELFNTYQPVGPLECSLLDELASLLWRKRRVLQAETALIRERASYLVEDRDSIGGDAARHRRVVRAALPAAGAEIPNRPEIGQTLMQGATDPKAAQKAYERIQHWTTIRRRLMCDEIGYRAVVREHLGEWRQYWADGIRMEEYTADSAGLAEFINDYPLDEYRTAYLDAHGGEVREQVAGQATFDYVTRARPLLSYEQHLDGKTKATIETLLALQRARLGG